jgi:hypothetical protein
MSLESKGKGVITKKRSAINEPRKKIEKDKVISLTATERTFNDINYRQEISNKFFGYIKSYESFYLIGGSSVGKTRLVEFLLRADVQEKYLGEQVKNLWIIRVDSSLLPNVKESWMFYELLLSSLQRMSDNRNASEELKTELSCLSEKVRESRDPLIALRIFELIVNKICNVYDVRLYFFFDEFDDAYQKLPCEIFSQLRAIRDSHKYRIAYILFLRNLPEKSRPPAENESFYELISRNVIGITPYAKTDAIKVIVEWENRRNCAFSSEIREKIYIGSAGHQGLAIAMLHIANNPSAKEKINDRDWLVWFGEQEYIREECKKILDGLDSDEKRILVLVANGNMNEKPSLSSKALTLKGLLIANEGVYEIFSPLLQNYIFSEVIN